VWPLAASVTVRAASAEEAGDGLSALSDACRPPPRPAPLSLSRRAEAALRENHGRAPKPSTGREAASNRTRSEASRRPRRRFDAEESRAESRVDAASPLRSTESCIPRFALADIEDELASCVSRRALAEDMVLAAAASSSFAVRMPSASARSLLADSTTLTSGSRIDPSGPCECVLPAVTESRSLTSRPARSLGSLERLKSAPTRRERSPLC
jgi:hypothetical protein